MISWHRYYDPATGRYISADPIGLAGGLNLYAYVGGDPLNFTDSEGLCGFGDCIIPGLIVWGISAAIAHNSSDVSDIDWPDSSDQECHRCTNYERIWDPNGKHSNVPKTWGGREVAPEPSYPDVSLQSAVPLSPNTDRLVGTDPYIPPYIVVFDCHYTDESNCKKYYHGHVPSVDGLKKRQKILSRARKAFPDKKKLWKKY